MAELPKEPHDPLDLQALELRAGEAMRCTIAVPDSDVTIGGQQYRLAVDGGAATLDVTHAHTGWHLRLRAAGAIAGPCWRCLEPAGVRLDTDLSEFGRFDRPAGAPFDEDLDSEYLDGHELDAVAMARDGLLDGLPATILCREGCAGLCPTCGARRDEGPCDCPPPPSDSRWDALRDIAARLEGETGG